MSIFSKADDLEDITNKVETLIKKYNKLHIIYIRVSTKMNQNEKNQLPYILKKFKLDKDKCIIFRAKESAYQLKKDNMRFFNVIVETIKNKKYKDVDKFLYVWHINRIYRNREKLVKFGLSVKDHKTKILSVRQSALSECLKYPAPMNDIIYYLMLQLYGQSAQEESENKGKDLLKSLTMKNGKLHTNKGRIFGNKLRTTTGKKIKWKVNDLINLEKAIYKRIVKKVSYRKIIELVAEKKQIKISMGYLTNLKNKYEQIEE